MNKTDEAIQRLMQQAEIGGWYKEDSTVPVRIGDLYESFKNNKAKNSRIEELESTLQKLLFAVTPVCNAAYNLAWQHRDEQSVHKNISVLDELRTQAYKLLEDK